MGTHTRPICTTAAVARQEDVGDTTNTPRTHYKGPLNPEKNPPVTLSYPVGTLLGGFWGV